MGTKSIDICDLIKRFNDNLLSEVIIFAGLEPILQIEEILDFVEEFRKHNSEDVVIYTGYNLGEILDSINRLKKFDNIIVKFGRYIPHSNKIYDDVLKMYLISQNQYAIKIS